MAEFRIERDSMGELQVPADALYGIQTLRAVENFPISGLRPLPAFVDAVVMIKRSAADTRTSWPSCTATGKGPRSLKRSRSAGRPSR